LSKNRWKLANPTQSLPQMPSTTLYCLKAITALTIGTYLNTTNHSRGIVSIT
jgi:hypothetical protein